ncbi:BolA family protein [Spectribacter hydrogenoxidans]|uniref:BolA family protein n=1 Tax=Spectribacter hydrogenoxidans TaxID=3075608 RepID=A0ABU3C1L9_9GAMM|nr:BolA family protein [Salinisphaera sp. W335]MDT0635458.1 BolA family protein [Salinisphaera sp. W335]
MTAERVQRIREALITELAPNEIDVIDESHKHIGHAGARSGLGHFAVVIRSARFAGCSLLERHRLVYDALGDMMRTDIHAVSIRALAPDD